MKVEDIIKKSASILNDSEMIDYLNATISSNTDIVERLRNYLLAVNMANNNLAANYIELINSKVVTSSEGHISFNQISDYAMIEIKKIIKDGRKVKFSMEPLGVKTVPGKVEIFYSYFPKDVELVDSIDYFTKINEMTFALSVVSEYLFLLGSIDDAYVWDTRFKNSLQNLLRPKRSMYLKERRWE